MHQKVSHALRLGLTLLILVLLVIFATKVNWHDIWASIRTASRTMLLAAALVNLLSIVVKAVRWWVFLRPIGATSLPLALRATFAGAGLNNVLVANGGEAARVVFVSRSAHITSAKVVATLALERLFELVGYVVLLSLAATFLDLPQSVDRVRPFAIVALVAMGALLIWLLRRPDVVEAVAGPKPATTPTGVACWRGSIAWHPLQPADSNSPLPSSTNAGFLTSASSVATSGCAASHCFEFFDELSRMNAASAVAWARENAKSGMREYRRKLFGSAIHRRVHDGSSFAAASFRFGPIFAMSS